MHTLSNKQPAIIELAKEKIYIKEAAVTHKASGNAGQELQLNYDIVSLYFWAQQEYFGLILRSPFKSPPFCRLAEQVIRFMPRTP